MTKYILPPGTLFSSNMTLDGYTFDLSSGATTGHSLIYDGYAFVPSSNYSVDATVYGASPNADSSTNVSAIQQAIDVVSNNGGGSILLPVGNLLINDTLTIDTSNVKLIGRGVGVSVITMASSFLASTASAINFYNSTFGTSRALAYDTVIGDCFVTLASAGNASGFSSGDWVLLRSLKPCDTEDLTHKFCAELHQVQTASTGTGVITFYGTISDVYTTALSASIIKISMLYNVGIENLTITHQATSAPLINSPALLFRNCYNATVSNVEIKNVFNTGLDMWSCVDSRVTGCSIDNVKSASSNTVYYGIWVSGASRGLTISNSVFNRCRHSIAMGTHTNTGTNTLSTDAREGIQRNILCQGLRSSASTTAHFDVHQPAEGIIFADCMAIGAWPQGAPDTTQWKTAVYGFQSRAKRVTFKDCLVEQTSGGFLLFGPAIEDNKVIGSTIRNIVRAGIQTQLSANISSGATTVGLSNTTGLSTTGSVTVGASTITYTGISSNNLTGCSGTPDGYTGQGVYQLVANTGNGIEMDSTCTGPGILIEACEIIETAASGVRGQGNQSRVSVIGCTLRKNSINGALGSIQFGGTSDHIDVLNNRIEQNIGSRPVSISGGDSHRIIDNYFYQNFNQVPSWVGANTIVRNNRGYTPGTVSSPFATLTPGTAWVTTTAYSVGNIRSNGGNNYICISAGTSDTGPSGTGTGNITDGTVLWKFLYPGAITSWAPITGVTQGTLRSNAGRVYECLADGTTDVAPSGGPVGNSLTSSISDGTTSWRFLYEGTEVYANISGGSAAPPSTYIQNIRSGSCEVIITSGTVTVITVNGTTVASSTTTPIPLKLGIGDTFSITYSVAPTIKVTYEGNG